MKRWLAETTIRKMEQVTGESCDYLRDIANVSGAAFIKFCMFGPFSQHCAAATPDVLAVARIVATRAEDCGPCLQTAVHQGDREGVDRAVLAAAAGDRPERLPDDLALIYRFACAVVEQAPEATRLSARVRDRFGPAVLVDLAIAISAVRVFPTLKRALGHAVSCSVLGLDLEEPVA